MNARKCVQPYPRQAFTHESSKVGGREKKRDRKERSQEADVKKGSTTKQKKKSEELKQGLLPRHSSG